MKHKKREKLDRLLNLFIMKLKNILEKYSWQKMMIQLERHYVFHPKIGNYRKTLRVRSCCMIHK